MNLINALWDAISAAASQDQSPRLRADGVPKGLCDALVGRSLAAGIGDGRLLIVYSKDATTGSYPLPSGVKSSVMGIGALTRCRNAAPTERFLVVVPSGNETEDSLSREVAAGIGDVLSNVEEVFYAPMRTNGGVFSQDMHVRLCDDAFRGQTSEAMAESRWAIMENVARLVELSWSPEDAYMASVGLPPFSEDGVSFSENILQKLAKFSELYAPKSAREFFAAAIQEDPELSERAEELSQALHAFFEWCEFTGSRKTSNDWKSPRRLYRHKPGFEALVPSEMQWRSVLDADTWSKLLVRHVPSLKVKVRVRGGVDPAAPELEPFYDGSKTDTYLVGKNCALSLLAKVDGRQQIVASEWYLKPKGGEQRELDENEEHGVDVEGLLDHTDGAEVICEGFYGENKAKAKLVKLDLDDLGYRIFVKGADLHSPVIQPGFRGDKACIALVEPGAFELVVAFDSSRYQIKSVSNGECYVSHELQQGGDSDTHSVAIVRSLDCDGSQQHIEIRLVELGAPEPFVQIVQVTAELDLKRGFRSWLHHLASCHAASRSFGRQFDAGVCAGMIRLLNAVWASPDMIAAKPLVVPVGVLLEGLEFVREPQTGIGYVSDDESSLRTYRQMFRDFALPEAVRLARQAFIRQVQGSSGDGSILNVDLTSSKVRSSCEDYLKAFELWMESDKESAGAALEWMDTIHFHAIEGNVGTPSSFILLPSHPLVAMGLVGMARLLEPSADDEVKWKPPLSRLYCSSGPKSWVIGLRAGCRIYDLITTNEHYFRVYLLRGSSEPIQAKISSYLRVETGLSVDCATLSLGSKDVVAVMDDICALNPALTEISVDVASDNSGFVTEGLFRWFQGLDDEGAPEHAGWGLVQPLNLRVSSSPEIVDEFDVEGRTAGVAGKTSHYLRWYEVSNAALLASRHDFSIFGELGSRPSGTSPASRDFPEAISLGRIGVSLGLSYVAYAGQREYAQSCGNGYVGSINLNRTPEAGGRILLAISEWNRALVDAHGHISYGDVGIAARLRSSQFVALPISGSADMQAVAGVDTNSAVWKFDNAEFDADLTNVAGHVILTGELDRIQKMMTAVLADAEIPVAPDEVRRILLDMGRAGINTLHALADNELVLLGAVSSLAVMRCYEGLQVARHSGDRYPVLVLPLDSFTRIFEQLNPGGTRPDFLCFSFERLSGKLRVQVDILEAKWRSDFPSYGELQRMLSVQVVPFKENLAAYFELKGDPQSDASAAVLLSELIAAAVRLKEAVCPDDPACSGLNGARVITEITAALFSGDAEIEFGKNIILACVSGAAERCSLSIEGGSALATMSAATALALLRDRSASVAWDLDGVLGVGEPLPTTPVVLASPATGVTTVSRPASPAADSESPSISADTGTDLGAPSVFKYPDTAESDLRQPQVADSPQTLDWPPKLNAFGMIGQDMAVMELTNKMSMLAFGRRFSDTMFIGPAGVGKSTFAREVAKRLKLQEIFLSGSDVKAPEALVHVLREKGRLPSARGNVIISACLIFIDEVHAIGAKASNFLLSALDDKRQATHEGRIYDFSNVVFLFATTDKGKLTQAFISRPHQITLPPYTLEELAGIIASKAGAFATQFTLGRDACLQIAARNRCSPRRAVRALEYQIVPHLMMKRPDGMAPDDFGSYLTCAATSEAIAAYYDAMGIDRNGLSNEEIKLLDYLKASSPASRERIRNFMRISNESDYAEISEYLDRLGLIETDSRGVSLTKLGLTYLASGRDPPDLTSRI